MRSPKGAGGILESNPAELLQIPKFDNQVDVELEDGKIKELYDLLYSYPAKGLDEFFKRVKK